MRKPEEILDEMVEAIVQHERNRDAEWHFHDKHGNPDFWDDDQMNEHKEILKDIWDSHDKLRDLIREWKGDPDFAL